MLGAEWKRENNQKPAAHQLQTGAPLYSIFSILFSPPLYECLNEGGVALACSQVKECHASEGLGVD